MSTNFILGLIFLCLALLTTLLKKTYLEIPLKELKKRKNLGEDLPQDFLTSLSYDLALRCLLWLVLAISLAAGLSLLSRSLPLWASIIIASPVVYFIFSYLPNSKVSNIDKRLTRLIAPGLNWLLKRTEKYLRAVYRPFIGHYRQHNSVIFDDEDLLNFLKELSRRKDSRINPEIFLNFERSIAFEGRRIKDLMTPAKKVKTLLEADVIGPILINELHESRDGYALVKEEPKGNITGLILLNDLSIRSQGKVSGHMRKDVCFINEDDFISSAIRAFFETKNTIFVVVNESHKFVGGISLATVIKELTGPLEFMTNNLENADKTDNEAGEYVPGPENSEQSS